MSAQRIHPALKEFLDDRFNKGGLGKRSGLREGHTLESPLAIAARQVEQPVGMSIKKSPGERVCHHLHKGQLTSKDQFTPREAFWRLPVPKTFDMPTSLIRCAPQDS